MPIELRVLAGRDLIGPDGRTMHTLLVQPKRFALLAYLLLDRPFRIHARDELLLLFWPDYREDNARNALSQALSFIRRSLGEGVIVTRGADGVAVDRELFTCDALGFDAAVARGDEAAALALYHRELLEGFHVDDAPEFDRWLAAERTHFRSRAVSCVHALTARAGEKSDFVGALGWAVRGAALAPHDEAIATQVIRLHDRLGNRSEALRAYLEYAARLSAELDLEPSADLAALAARIRTGSGSGTDAAAVARGGDAAIEVVASDVGAAIESGTRRPAPGRRAVALWLVSTIVLGALAAAVAWISLGGRAPQVQPLRFTLTLDDSLRLSSQESGVTMALSPDGSQLVYLGGSRAQYLYIRALNDLAPRRIDGTEDASNPSFSPDGRWLAFKVHRRLKSMPASGGPSVTLADSVSRYSWGDGNVIVFEGTDGIGGGLWLASAAGGTPPVRLTTVDTARGETRHTWPFVLPGGKSALFEIGSGPMGTDSLAAMRLADHKVVRLGLQGTNPRYVPSGHIIFARLDGSVFAVPFDARRLRLTGPAIRVLEGVIVKNGGAMELAIARNGTLVYVPASTERQVVLVDRKGTSRPLWPQIRSYLTPRFSPDGKRLAVVVGTPGHTDVWIYNMELGTSSRLTNDDRSDQPSWTPDGHRIAWRASYGTSSSDLKWQKWAGNGTAETLLRDAGGGVLSPSGGFFIEKHNQYGTPRAGPGTAQVELVSLDSTRHRIALGPDMKQVKISPDGRSLAYNLSSPIQMREVYVKAIPGSATGAQFSIGRGVEPVWGPSGQELFIRSHGKIVAVRIATVPEFAVVRRDTLFDDVYWSTPNNLWFADYDVSPDGKHFVFLKPSGGPPQPIVVIGWLDELRARMAMAGGN